MTGDHNASICQSKISNGDGEAAASALHLAKDFGKYGALKLGNYRSGRPRSRNCGNIESFIRLDIRDWGQAGLLKRGTAHQMVLPFTNHLGSTTGKVAIVIVIPKHGDPTVILGLVADGEPGGRRITLNSMPCRFGGERFYFICPVRGERCEVLVCVGGQFASRKAHRLTYRSQSQWPLQRARERLSGI